MTALYALDHVSRRFTSSGRDVTALDDLSLTIGQGERWGIVGGSGSGKTTLVRLLAGLDAPSSGTIRFEGQPLNLPGPGASASARRVLARVQLVFQDPMSSLDPRMRVGAIIAEPLRSRSVRADWPPQARRARVDDLIAAVGLPQGSAQRYPHEFSGGQRQRIAIARALAPRPDVLIADEPVSALDVSVRAHIINVLNEISDRLGLTLVLVSHDLAVVRHLCDHVAVLRSGRLVEAGPAEDILTTPRDPYTQALLAAQPTL
jgi:peptide/nickel transport system ATP-binding protein